MFSIDFKRLLRRWPVKLLCIAMAMAVYILFRVNTLSERQINLPLKIYIKPGFVVSSEYPNTINLTMRGEGEDILSILPGDIEAHLDLRPFDSGGEYEVAVEITKRGTALGVETLELLPRPRQVLLSQESRTAKSIDIKPELSGFPASGFELIQYFVSPSTVTVIGPNSQMKDLNSLKTELIDLSGRRKDFSITTRIIPPSSQITIRGGQVVEFRGVIEEVVVIRTIPEIEVVMLDLRPGLKIQDPLPKVSLTIQGRQLEVEGARLADLTFYLDGGDIQTPGSYVLPLRVDIPPGLAILRLLPQEARIKVVADIGNNQ